MEQEIKLEYGEAASGCRMLGNPEFAAQVNVGTVYPAPSFKDDHRAALGVSEQYYLQPADNSDVAAMTGLPYHPGGVVVGAGGTPGEVGNLAAGSGGGDPPMFVRYSIEQGESELNSKCLPKKYKCGMCIYKTSYKSDLNRHLKKHNMEHAYRCHLCNMPFKTPGNVYNHMRNMHFHEMQFLQCQQCAYVAMDEAAIRHHLLSCHGGVGPGTGASLLPEEDSGAVQGAGGGGYPPTLPPALHGFPLETRQLDFSSPPGVPSSAPSSEITTTVGRSVAETSSSNPEILIDVDESGRENSGRTSSQKLLEAEVDLVSDEDPTEEAVASSSRSRGGGEAGQDGWQQQQQLRPWLGSGCSSGSQAGEREELPRPPRSSSGRQERLPASTSTTTTTSSSRRRRSTPESSPSQSCPPASGSAHQSPPHLTSSQADLPRPSSGGSETSSAAGAEARAGQIERQMADTTGRHLSSPTTSRPATTTVTSPVNRRPTALLRSPDGGPPPPPGPPGAPGPPRGPWMRTVSSSTSSRPPSVLPGQGGDALPRRRLSSLKAARHSVSRAADSLRGRSFLSPRRQQCEGCREFFHTPQFMARHRSQCPAVSALRGSSSSRPQPGAGLPHKVLPPGPGHFPMSGMSPVSPHTPPAAAAGGLAAQLRRQHAEDGAVTNAPPASGRYARLVSDFDNFAARPFACALCFFRTANATELVQHVDNHLTGCNAAPVPDTARFSTSWSAR